MSLEHDLSSLTPLQYPKGLPRARIFKSVAVGALEAVIVIWIGSMMIDAAIGICQ